MENHYEVAIIGGSNAGMSAALALGRSLRKVIVIDNELPCNRQTPHSHNFLSRDGVTPAFLSTVSREQVLAYPTVRWMKDTVEKIEQTAGGFRIFTREHQELGAKKLLLATGITDDLLPIPGFADCWGISVLHCPYCHGYEVKRESLAVLANGEMAMEFVHLIRQWSTNLKLFTNGPSFLQPEQEELLRANCIPVITSPVTRMLHQDGQLFQMELENGSVIPLKALFAKLSFKQSPLVEQLGIQLNEQGFIIVNPFQQTSLPHVFAAGDCTTPMRSVSTAVAQGTMAGAAINKFLLQW